MLLNLLKTWTREYIALASYTFPSMKMSLLGSSFQFRFWDAGNHGWDIHLVHGLNCNGRICKDAQLGTGAFRNLNKQMCIRSLLQSENKN